MTFKEAKLEFLEFCNIESVVIRYDAEDVETAEGWFRQNGSTSKSERPSSPGYHDVKHLNHGGFFEGAVRQIYSKFRPEASRTPPKLASTVSKTYNGLG